MNYTFQSMQFLKGGDRSTQTHKRQPKGYTDTQMTLAETY